MSLQVWLPLNQEPKNVICGINEFNKETGIIVTSEENGWYKILDSIHASSNRWGIYKDFYVKSNTTYTLKIYSKSTTGVTASIGIQSYNGYVSWPAQRDTNNTSTEKLTTYTWTTAATDNWARIYLAINTTTTVANNYVFYKGVEILEAPEIKNQGLNNNRITASIGYNDWVTNGKLGTCLKTTTTNHIDLGFNGNQVNTGSISFGGWFKFNKTEMQTLFNTYTFTDVRNQPTGNLIGNNSYGGVSLNWYTNNMYSSSGVLNNLYILGSIRTSNNGARTTSGIEIPFGVWVNLYVVFNKETKILQLWKDGVLQQFSTMLDFDDARNQNLMLNYNAVWGGNGPSFNLPFLVNDVRIYNHALSEKEIKKISQGLVCHYSLSNMMIENTTNLITTEDCLSSTCYNGSTSKYGYGTTTDMYKTVTTFENRKGTKVYMGTNGNNCYPYVYISGMYTSNGTNSPAYKTLSFDYYTTISTSICPYKLGSGTGTATYIVKANGTKRTGTGTNAVVIPIVPNVWNHVEVTFHGTTDDDAQWGYIQNQPAHVSNTNNFWFFANMQLETKDHATEYAGVGKTRTTSMIYDSSGFDNYGIISGALSVSSDTSKYYKSTYFASGSNYIDADRGAMINDSITVNLWCKFSTWGNPISCTEGGGWNFESINENGIQFPVYISGVGYVTPVSGIQPSTLLNGWHMLTGTVSGTEIKIYIDGVLKGTKTKSASNNIAYAGGNAILIGAEASGTHAPAGTAFIGNISDVRIYATALSAEDVLALYNNKNF